MMHPMLHEGNYSLGYPRISECEVSVEFIQRVMRAAWRKALTPPRCIRIFEAAHVHDNDASSTSAAERSTSSSAERCPTNSAANTREPLRRPSVGQAARTLL